MKLPSTTIGLLVGALCLPLLGGCTQSDAAEPSASAPAERPPPGVRVVRAVQQDLSQNVEFTGEMRAFDRVDLAPETSGRLLELTVDEGDFVVAGQRIARLDDDLIRRRRGEALARLESARAQVSRARADETQQANEVDRRAPLTERNAFPAAELARLQDALSVAGEAVAVARAQEQEAEAALAAVRTELGQADVVAPFDGLVVTRHVTAGAMVSPQQPLVTLVDETSLRFVFRLAEERLGEVSEGTLAQVYFDSEGEAPFAGRVSYIGRVVERESRTVQVRLEIEAEDATIRDGMFGRGHLTTRTLEDAVVVPLGAVQETVDGTLRVWVVNDDDTVTAHPVTVLLRTEEALAVEGIPADSRLVMSAPMGLTEGSKVYVVGDTDSGAAP